MTFTTFMVRLVASVARFVSLHVSRRLGSRLRRILPGIRMGFPIVMEYEGVRLAVHTGEEIGRRIYYQGDYERTQIDIFRKYLVPGGLFYDIGANIGVYTVVAGKGGMRCVSIEPSPIVAKALSTNIELNGLSHMAVVINGAVSDKAGSLPFFEGRASNMGVGHTYRVGGDTRDAIEVNADTLDAYVSRLGKPAVIKIDIEGFELAAFHGARTVLADEGPLVVMVELHPGEIAQLGGTVDECINELVGTGFDQYKIASSPDSSHLWRIFTKGPGPVAGLVGV